MPRTLLIDIDSLRPDHVGAYDCAVETTPNVDDLAADSVTFDRAYVANSPCLPSRAGLVSGRYGINNSIETHGPLSQHLDSPAHRLQWAGTWSDHVESRPWWTLPELFFENRITTAGVSSFPRHPAPWFYHVWHEFYQPQEPEQRGSAGEEVDAGESFQTPRAETVVDHGLEFLKDNGDDGFFLYL